MNVDAVRRGTHAYTCRLANYQRKLHDHNRSQKPPHTWVEELFHNPRGLRRMVITRNVDALVPILVHLEPQHELSLLDLLIAPRHNVLQVEWHLSWVRGHFNKRKVYMWSLKTLRSNHISSVEMTKPL